MNSVVKIGDIQTRIFTIRGVQVMLDEDLANFYKTELKRLNEQVKRNIDRFPKEFMFQLTQDEFDNLRSQIVPLKSISLRSQFATIENYESLRGKHRKYLPYVFTEQGVSMLSAVLHSKIAIQISIQIINAFIQMRQFLLTNKDTFQRLNIIETKLLEYDNNFNKIFNLLKTNEPKTGIFFNNQFFDSHSFISDLIRRAKKEIILIDNYVDERTLNLFKKKEKQVNVIIYTKNITNELKDDIKKFNKQYGNLESKKFSKSHDRFLVIDDEVYHIGASLKDIGQKWTAFSKLEDFIDEIKKRLN